MQTAIDQLKFRGNLLDQDKVNDFKKNIIHRAKSSFNQERFYKIII